MGGANSTTYGPYDQPLPQSPTQKFFGDFVDSLKEARNPTPKAPPVPEYQVPVFQRQYVDVQPVQPRELPPLNFTPRPVIGQYTGGGSNMGGGAGNIPAQQSSMNRANSSGSAGNSLRNAFADQADSSPQGDRTAPSLRGSF